MSGKRIYVASSWRNPHQPLVVKELRAAGLDVYDFRQPSEGEHGFAWSNIDPDWLNWSPMQWRDALSHPLARHGFGQDMAALRAADKCLLVLPCGRSAHLELGWACGMGKPTAVLALEHTEPDLMVAMCDRLCCWLGEAVDWCTGRVAANLSRESEG